MATKAGPIRKRKLRKTLFTRKPKKARYYKSDDFQVGDFVFAKLRGHSPWPARIDQIHGGKYLVYFYGSLKTAFMRRSELFHFDKYRYEFCTLARLKRNKFYAADLQITIAIKQYNAIAKLNGTNKYVNIVISDDNEEDENDDTGYDDEAYEDLEINEVIGDMTNNTDSNNDKHQVNENSKNNASLSKSYKKNQNIQRSRSGKNDQSIQRSRSGKNDLSIQKSKSYRNKNSDKDLIDVISIRGSSAEDDNESCKSDLEIVSIHGSESASRYPSVGASRYPSESASRYPSESASRYPSESASRYPSESASRYPSESASRYPSESASRYPSESASRYPSECISINTSESASVRASEVSRKTVLPKTWSEAKKVKLTESERKLLVKEKDFLIIFSNVVSSLALGKPPQLNRCLTQLRILKDFLIHVEPLMLIKHPVYFDMLQKLCRYGPAADHFEIMSERQRKIIMRKVKDIRRKAAEIIPKLQNCFMTNIPEGKTFEDVYNEELKIFNEKTANFTFVEKGLISVKKQYLKAKKK